MYQSILAFMIFFASAFASAQQSGAEIQFGQAKVLGKGCSQDNVQFVPSFDGRSFSVLFTDFTLESDKFYEYRLCRILVPVKVPAGQKIEIRNMDLRGFVSLPKGSIGGIGALPRFLDKQGRSHSSKKWTTKWVGGEFEDEVTIHKNFKKPVQSLCGQVQWMEINAYIGQMGFAHHKQTRMVALDSLDAAGVIVGSLQTQTCTKIIKI